VLVVVACVLGGIHGIEPLLAFGLGAFAAASAGRALVLSVRGAWRGARTAGQPPARAALAGWRGLVGRANGGMVVHIGIVVIAVGLAGATAFGQRGTVVIVRGETSTFAGHTVEFVGTRIVRSLSHISQEALLRVDGGAVFTPAISQFGTGTQAVGTPAIDSSVTSDVYLTINSIPDKGGAWTFGVVVQPLVMWLWIGGALVVVGSVLSAIPGRRRRPTDPVSAPVTDAASPGEPGTSGTAPDRTSPVAPPMTEVPAPTREPERQPVGAGDAP
jgi:cytochrome c-type biogenesis protein CcmF